MYGPKIARWFIGCFVFVASLLFGASSSHAADILVEADLVRVETREVPAGSGIFRVFVVATGNGPFKTSIGGAAEIELALGTFGSARIAGANIARMGFASRAFANGSLIYNTGAGTWTGMTIWRVDAAGDVFAAASAGGNGVVLARAADAAGAANRRLNITIPNLTRYVEPGQRNVLWVRMPLGAATQYEGSLTGVAPPPPPLPPPPLPPASPSETCILAPDINSYQELVALAANYDYDLLFEQLEICPLSSGSSSSTGAGGASSAGSGGSGAGGSGAGGASSAGSGGSGAGGIGAGGASSAGSGGGGAGGIGAGGASSAGSGGGGAGGIGAGGASSAGSGGGGAGGSGAGGASSTGSGGINVGGPLCAMTTPSRFSGHGTAFGLGLGAMALWARRRRRG